MSTSSTDELAVADPQPGSLGEEGGHPQPSRIYDELVSDRDDFIDKAVDVAELTMPWLKPAGSDIEEQPWTSQGTSSVRNLSSTSMKIMMPSGVQWGRLDFPIFVWDELEVMATDETNEKVTVATIEALKRTLKARSQEIILSLGQKNVRSRLGMAVTRNLVEGSTAVHNTVDGVRIFPLRSFVCRRDQFGDVEFLVLKHVTRVAPEDIKKKGDAAGHRLQYTFIDFVKDEVWFQDGNDDDAPVTKMDEPSDRYMVIVSELPDVDNYPVGYFYNFIRLIASINHAESGLADAMSLASWNPLGIREGSALATDTDQITTKKTGDAVIMQEGDAFPAIVNQMKLGEWAFVGQVLEQDKAELAAISAKGIKDRALPGATSATAVIQMIDELSSQSADLLGAYEESFQRPLFASEHSILEEHAPMFDDETQALLGKFLKVTVITGINALEKQRSFALFITQDLPLVMQLDPTVAVDGIAILDRRQESLLMDLDGIYFRREQQAPVAGGAEAGDNAQFKKNRMTRGGPQGPQTQPASAQNQQARS